jgi:hypothetical protein
MCRGCLRSWLSVAAGVAVKAIMHVVVAVVALVAI